MAYTRATVLTLDDFAKLPSTLVWGAIDEAYNAGTNPFRSAGVLVSDPVISQTLAEGNGIRTEVEAWNDLAYQESNISNDDPTIHATPIKMQSKVWGAVRQHRNVGVSGMDLVRDFTGVTPLELLGSRIANYKNNDEVAVMFAVLDGLTKADASAKKYTYTMTADLDILQILSAVQAMKGDNGQVAKALGMNSTNYLKLLTSGMINKTLSQDVQIETVAGLRIIVDDRFGARIVVMGPGLFHYSSQPQALNSVGVERDESAGNGSGQGTAWFRWKQIIHPMGFSFAGTYASKGGPSFAELNTAGAYTLATDVKKIPLIIVNPKAV